MQSVRERIMQLLINKDLTETEFARKIGVRTSTVSMWLSGDRNPNIYMVVRICKAFHVSADWLLGLEE